MSRFEHFVQFVQAEALYLCLSRPQAGIRPSEVLAVALQCPQQALSHTTEGMRYQAQELADWFFGGPDPDWLPEQLMFEEVEEIVEEYVDEEEDDDEEFVYEITEEYVEGDGY